MNQLRVYWITNVPGECFYVPVVSLAEAVKILDMLANYDNFLLAQDYIPDWSNVGGVEEFVDEEWIEWEDAEGNGIHDLTLEEALICDVDRRRSCV